MTFWLRCRNGIEQQFVLTMCCRQGKLHPSSCHSLAIELLHHAGYTNPHFWGYSLSNHDHLLNGLRKLVFTFHLYGPAERRPRGGVKGYNKMPQDAHFDNPATADSPLGSSTLSKASLLLELHARSTPKTARNTLSRVRNVLLLGFHFREDNCTPGQLSVTQPLGVDFKLTWSTRRPQLCTSCM